MDIENGAGGDRGFTTTTSQSYFAKLKGALCGVCIGFLLFFGSIGLLAWNEGRTVKRAHDLDEGRNSVRAVPLSGVAQYSERLIYTTGRVSTTDPLADPIFGVAAPSPDNSTATTLKLARSVEMYQWQESKQTKEHKTASGATETVTTYSYARVWSPNIVNSNSFFRQTNEYGDSVANPNQFPYPAVEWIADPILFGNLTLPNAITSQLNWFETVAPLSLETVPDATLRSRLSLQSSSSTFFLPSGTSATTIDTTGNGTTVSSSTSSNTNRVGDARFTFKAVPADAISVVAVPTTTSSSSVVSTLRAHKTATGNTLLLVERGIVAVDDMFTHAENANTTLAWILRFVGFLIMFVSILLVLNPISAAMDIVPFVGSFLGDQCLEGCIFPLIAVLISVPLSLMIIMLAWTAHRPTFAIPVATTCLALLVCLCWRARTARPHNVDDVGQDDGPSKPQPDDSSSPPPSYGQPAGKEPLYEDEAESPLSPNGDFASALDK